MASTDFMDAPPATESDTFDPTIGEGGGIVRGEVFEEPSSPTGPSCEKCGRVIERKPGARGRMPKYHPECRPSSPKKSGGTRKARKAGPYEEGINGFFGTAAFGLFLLGKKDESNPFTQDAATVAEHGPNVASALDQLAQEKPEVAAILDKVLAVGPYGVLLGALAPMVLGIMDNHGVMEKFMGKKDAPIPSPQAA